MREGSWTQSKDIQLQVDVRCSSPTVKEGSQAYQSSKSLLDSRATAPDVPTFYLGNMSANSSNDS